MTLLKKRSWGVRGILRGLRGVLSQNTPYPLKRMSFIIKQKGLSILNEIRSKLNQIYKKS
ncbi:hypothetical protein D2C83_04255 [Helicobacter pylori]|nr:hypothetical protein D2C83_04255 [Helicobacter pylori]